MIVIPQFVWRNIAGLIHARSESVYMSIFLTRAKFFSRPFSPPPLTLLRRRRFVQDNTSPLDLYAMKFHASISADPQQSSSQLKEPQLHAHRPYQLRPLFKHLWRTPSGGWMWKDRGR